MIRVLEGTAGRVAVIFGLLVYAAFDGVHDVAQASNEAALDSIRFETIPLDSHAHQGLKRVIAESSSDSLSQRGRSVLRYALRQLESSCRSELWSKEEEPGSPWLSWRSRRRIVLDGRTWFVGALSCTDSLCGGEFILNDRVAFLCLGTDSARLTFLPGEPPTMRADGSADVDSVAMFPGKEHVLVQARRRVASEHPCLWGPHSYEGEEHCFAVLKGDRVVQAFRLIPSSSWSEHNDVEGDRGAFELGTLRVSAEAIEMDIRIDEWSESVDAEREKTHRTVTRRVTRLEYSAKTGRFELGSTPTGKGKQQK